MFVDLDWPLNALSLLSASAELLVLLCIVTVGKRVCSQASITLTPHWARTCRLIRLEWCTKSMLPWLHHHHDTDTDHCFHCWTWSGHWSAGTGTCILSTGYKTDGITMIRLKSQRKIDLQKHDNRWCHAPTATTLTVVAARFAKDHNNTNTLLSKLLLYRGWMSVSRLTAIQPTSDIM